MSGASKSDFAGRGGFRFSVRRLLIFTAAIAVLLAVGVTVYRAQLAKERPWLFHEAVQSGNLAEADRLLDIDPRLAQGRQHGTVSSSHTPLQKAIVFGPNPKIVDRILQERPDLDETSSSGETALHLAVQHQKLVEVEKLVRLGADVNAVDEDGTAPLHLAAMVDRDGNLTKLLLQGGANPNEVQPASKGPDGKAALHIAAERGNATAVKHLLDAGADVDLRDMRGRTALHFAVSQGRSEIAKLLMERGADLTSKDHAGRIPGERSDGSNADIAATLWWEQIVRLHDQNKIDELDAVLDDAPQALYFGTGYTPSTMLHRAVFDQRLDVLDYLLARGFDPNAPGAEGQTAQHSTCWWKPVEFAERLLDAGANIEATDDNGQTPLHWAAKAHHHDVLEFLIAQGANVDALDNAGTTVLDAAFERTFHRSDGHQTLELLRQAGHKPTVLYAAATGDLELLRELTRDDPEALDRGYTQNGIRPLHAAVVGGQPEIIRWLVEQGVDLNACTSRDETSAPPVDPPLMTALSHDQTEIAILLIELGANSNVSSVRGTYRPAHAVIAWDRDPEILASLLDHGADPTLRLKHESKTALELASESKSKNRDRYLELLGVD